MTQEPAGFVPDGFVLDAPVAVASSAAIPSNAPPWAARIIGAGQGMEGGLRGFVRGLAASPRALVEGTKTVLTQNPLTTAKQAVEGVVAIPGAVMRAGADPEAWGEGVGNVTGQTMIGMAGPKVLAKVPAAAGRLIGEAASAVGDVPEVATSIGKQLVKKIGIDADKMDLTAQRMELQATRMRLEAARSRTRQAKMLEKIQGRAATPAAEAAAQSMTPEEAAVAEFYRQYPHAAPGATARPRVPIPTPPSSEASVASAPPAGSPAAPVAVPAPVLSPPAAVEPPWRQPPPENAQAIRDALAKNRAQMPPEPTNVAPGASSGLGEASPAPSPAVPPTGRPMKLAQAREIVTAAQKAAGMKLTASEMRDVTKLVQSGHDADTVIRLVPQARGEIAAAELARRLGTPSTKEVWADFHEQAVKGKKSLVPRYGGSEP